MNLTVELRDSDGVLLHRFSGDRDLHVMGPIFEGVAGLTVTVDTGVDEFVDEHLAEIIGIAAAGIAWRDEARKPHPDEASQKASFKKYMRYTTVLDTVSDELRVWLMSRVPKTSIKLREGG